MNSSAIGLFIIIASGQLSIIQGFISTNFDQCRQDYFYNGRPPRTIKKINNVDNLGNDADTEEICQSYEGITYFATLYDKKYKIPRYSAYLLDPNSNNGGQPSRRSTWFIEPDLVEKGKFNDMSTLSVFGKTKEKMEFVANSQATDDDYEGSLWDKGHLNPNNFQNGAGRTATFTLTNAVPQDSCLNRNYWKEAEDEAKKLLFQHCNGKVYFITGAVPDDDKAIYVDNKPKISIPKYMYSAACCDHNTEKWNSFSFAFAAENKAGVAGVAVLTVWKLSEMTGIDFFANDQCYSRSIPTMLYVGQFSKWNKISLEKRKEEDTKLEKLQKEFEKDINKGHNN